MTCINEVFLSSAINSDDALSIDVQYHRTCWTKYLVRAQENQVQQEKFSLKENEVAADVEFLNLVKGLLLEGRGASSLLEYFERSFL